MTVPLLINQAFIILTTAIVIYLSRRNLKISSHKKHILQSMLILQVNFLLGSPKLQTQNSIISIFSLLTLLCHADFSTMGTIYSLSLLPNRCSLWLLLPALLHLFFFSDVLNHFVMECRVKQADFEEKQHRHRQIVKRNSGASSSDGYDSLSHSQSEE